MTGKRALGLCVLMCVFALGFAVGNSAPPQERPPGVEPHLWVPVTDNLGLALRTERTVSGPALFGTFMVRRGEHWQPVHIDREAPQVTPAQ
jgi:hypothetical protein